MIQAIDVNRQKQLSGEYAIKYIKDDIILGVGTGSTIKYFIDKLATVKHKIKGAVASSEQTSFLLKSYKIPIYDLNHTGTLDLYIDGADEIDHDLQMIKGGGGALTREKILASASRKFICIADESKYVDRLGKFPIAVEVIPMARSYVAREIVKLGGMPTWRSNVLTDNGNYILDVYNLEILSAIELEKKLNSIAGVVDNGLFGLRPANELVLTKSDGTIEIIK